MATENYPSAAEPRFVKHTATGAGAMAEQVVAPVASRLLWVGLHLSAAPTTSENLTVTYDSAAGSAYDVLMQTRNLATEAITDLSWVPEDPVYLLPGDAVAVAFTNTDTKTWGLSVVLEAL